MPRPSLSGSRKTTAKAVAEKIAGKGSTKSTSAVADKIPVASSPIVSSNSTGFSTVCTGISWNYP
jgi:GTP-sensing pleiotropic transcriptional regulator CodY